MSLKDPSVYTKYNNLWENKLSPTTNKKIFGLVKFNNLDLSDIGKNDLYKTIFKILFNVKNDKTILRKRYAFI